LDASVGGKLERDDSGLMRMACWLALTHHKKWDGSGYPKGLAGKATTSRAHRGARFDPALVDVFLQNLSGIAEIREHFTE